MRRIFLVLVTLNLAFWIHGQAVGNAEELLSKIFNFNSTITPRQIKFEDSFESQIDEDSKQYQPITFDEQTRPNSVFRFENEPTRYTGDLDDVKQTNDQGFTFQDDNEVEAPIPPVKIDRKPKYQNFRYTDQYTDKLQDYQDTDNLPNQPFSFNQQSEVNGPLKFEIDPVVNNNNHPNLQDSNNQGLALEENIKDEPKPPKKRRRRRRRRPKYQNGYQGISNPGYPSQYPNPQGYPSNIPQGYPNHNPNVGYQNYPVNQQGYPGQFAQSPQGPGGQYPYPGNGAGQYYRPPRRPKQSVASEALSAVTGALTSIALYDDYQCVPRLLCEAAGGGALGSSSVLQNIAGLQPLLTLLSAYNGVSSSPLFIFGRAVFLGMTAKGNLGTCRYAYPQCPNDPEQLVHYLNNHNGGFFRFFNAPQLNPLYGQQNVEQFYNQLSQNYGIYQPGQAQVANQQNYGFYQPNTPNQPNNGIYQNIPNQINGPTNQANQQGYGFPNPNLYDNGPQNYGLQNYGPAYQNNYGFNRFKSNDKDAEKSKIEKRILNGPKDSINNDFDNDNPKWLLTESNVNNKDFNNYRGGKVLKFPDEEIRQQLNTPAIYNDGNRQEKGFSFPNYQSNIKYVNYNTKPTTLSYDKYGLYQNEYHIENTTPNYQNNYYSNDNYRPMNQNNYYQNNNEDVETVYIVRGNGDPNHPEIVKLKPGEKLQ